MSKLYRVSCACPTPLEANPFECVADSRELAIDKFFRRNGISGSDHELTVEEVVAVSESLPPVELGGVADQETTTNDARQSKKKGR